jgi:DEAD/DEAH box helicase
MEFPFLYYPLLESWSYRCAYNSFRQPFSKPFLPDRKRSQSSFGTSPTQGTTHYGWYQVRLYVSVSFHVLLYFISQNTEAKVILNHECHILIASPGRLLDHLRSIPLAERLANLQTVVFDEADRLLDQGFKRDLDAIIEFLPKKETRQSLLFSATISKDIKEVKCITCSGTRTNFSFLI